MPGAKNANGVYIYNETDLRSPFSTLLNKLAQSVSDILDTRVHAEFDWAKTGVVTATSTASGTPTIRSAAGYSKSTWSSFYVPQAGGIKLVNPGRYIISATATISAASAARTFVQLTVEGLIHRAGFAAGEDRENITVELATLTANQAVAIDMFQASGANRDFSGVIRIEYLGPI